MHAFLIVGNNPEKEIASRIALWKISAWDTIYLPNEGTIGIDLVRDFERELALTPRNSPAKVGVLTDMDRLTPEAQNALLKTLEEPPPHTYIIGTTNNPEALLPTVRSRMSVVRLMDIARKSDTSILLKLLRESPGQRITTIDPFVATREDAKQFVTSLLGAAREELLKHPTRELSTLIRNLLTAESQLSVNVNPKLVLDNAVLHISDTVSV
jgi:DNA polymerase III delta prime subunit